MSMDSRLAAYIASLPPNGVQRPLFPLAGTAAPSGSFWQQVRAAGLVRRSGTLLGVHALETVFLFASWVAVGSGALSGLPARLRGWRVGQGERVGGFVLRSDVVAAEGRGQRGEGRPGGARPR